MATTMNTDDIKHDTYQKRTEPHSHVEDDKVELKDGTVVEVGEKYGLSRPGDSAMVESDDKQRFIVEVYALTWIPHDMSYEGDPVCHLEIYHKLRDVPGGYEHLIPRDDKTAAWNFEGAKKIDD